MGFLLTGHRLAIIALLIASLLALSSCVQETSRPGSLVLDVEGPEDGAVVYDDAVVVHGYTSSGATLLINDQVVTVSIDGRFQAEVALSLGSNLIIVVATDEAGRNEQQTISIDYLIAQSSPFLLLITQPKDQSIVSTSSIILSGRTATDAIVSINGVTISVNETGLFTTSVALIPGPNTIDIVATSTDGKVMSTVIAIIYRP
jgi:hypothetical protein